MNCPCGSDNCSRKWCRNNWLQCRKCGHAGHEDHFYDSFRIPHDYDDNSNRDPIICKSCMYDNFFCVKCKKLLPTDDSFSVSDEQLGICKGCIHEYKDFIKLFFDLDDSARLDLINDVVDTIRYNI